MIVQMKEGAASREEKVELKHLKQRFADTSGVRPGDDDRGGGGGDGFAPVALLNIKQE